MILDNFIQYVDLNFYVKLAIPLGLSIIFLFIQSVLDKVKLSSNDEINKFNHFFVSMVLFLVAYFVIAWFVFGFMLELAPVKETLLFAGIVFGQFLLLFILNIVTPISKFVNWGLVSLLSGVAWVMYWMAWR